MTALRGAMPFSDIPIVPGLSLGDLLLAAALAWALTELIARGARRGPAEPPPFDTARPPEFIRPVMERCYALFPIDTVHFRGETFKRGMIVKITTAANRTMEGRLLGLNDDNVICLLTARKLAADYLDNVEEIVVVETGGGAI